MTLHDSHTSPTTTSTQDDSIRLEMNPAGAPLRSVDGVWWPRTDDLETEVVGLLAALRGEYGSTERVAYRFEDWQSAHRRIDSAAGQIKLDGYHHRDPRTVAVVGSSQRQCILEVIPSTSSDHDAQVATAHALGTEPAAA